VKLEMLEDPLMRNVWVVFVLASFLLMLAIYPTFKRNSELRAQCESAGGTQSISNEGPICVRPNQTKQLP